MRVWDLATNSLERALLLLNLVEQTPGGLTNAEISRQLRIPKSSCSYILSRLEREGYLIRDAESGRYNLGLTTVTLAHGALREIGIRTVAEPALYKLTSETGLSAGIGVLQRGRVLLVDRVEGPRFLTDTRSAYRTRAQRDIGRELPVNSTALGKVLLAYLPRQQALKFIREHGLPRSAANTMDRVRAQGYAIADREADAALRALSVPILDADGTVHAAVSVNGSPSDSAWRDLEELVKTVQEAARDISRRARMYRVL